VSRVDGHRNSLTFDSAGTIVEVQTTDERFLRDIARLYQHFPRSKGPPHRVFSVTREEDRFSVTSAEDLLVDRTTRDEALMDLLVAINGASILGCRNFVVHAGAVARAGRVVAFPAKKRAGKSTMVAALLQAGFEYVTDEALIFDTSRDRVMCYPKALWLTDTSRDAVRLSDVSLKVDDRFKSPVLPEELGGAIASDGLELTDVVLLERNHGPTRIEPLSGIDVAHALIEHSFNRDRSPHEWFRAVARVARSTAGSRLAYGEIESAVRQLSEYLEAEPHEMV
jgi:hypothetical protein